MMNPCGESSTRHRSYTLSPINSGVWVTRDKKSLKMARKVWNFEISYTFVYTKVQKKSEIKKKNLNSDFNLNSHRPVNCTHFQNQSFGLGDIVSTLRAVGVDSNPVMVHFIFVVIKRSIMSISMWNLEALKTLKLLRNYIWNNTFPCIDHFSIEWPLPKWHSLYLLISGNIDIALMNLCPKCFGNRTFHF